MINMRVVTINQFCSLRIKIFGVEGRKDFYSTTAMANTTKVYFWDGVGSITEIDGVGSITYDLYYFL